MTRKETFLKKLRETFRTEAEDHLRALSSGVLEMAQEEEAQAAVLVEALYREAHSLKGAARSVNRTDIESVARSLEDVLGGIKRGEVARSAAVFDALHSVIDALGGLVASSEPAPVADLVQRLSDVTPGSGDAPEAVAAPSPEAVEDAGPAADAQAPPPLPRQERAAPEISETIRIATAKLDSLLFQAEEMLSVKLTVAQRAAESREVHAALGAWRKAWAKAAPYVRGARQVVDGDGDAGRRGQTALLGRLLEFLDWNETHIKALDARLADLTIDLDHDRRTVGGMVDQLLEDMKVVRMYPFSAFAEGFPKLVRDLCRDQGKEADFVLQGAEIEVDRRILEEMKDPLIHLLRNAVDHGIEAPDDRARAGKPQRGTVTLAVSQVAGNRMEVVVSDDGAGMDATAVKAAAVARGVVSGADAEALDDTEALSLIFESEVSTSPLITDISGRGLGLAIVRERAERLGGTVTVETVAGRGTAFRLALPLTLATFRGILVKAGGRAFVAPAANVERVLRVRAEDVQTVENREALTLDGRAVPLVRLADVLELPPQQNGGHNAAFIPALVLGAAARRIAFAVDEVVNEQVVLLKSLGKQLSRVRNVAGATVLGSGEVAPVLNALDLLKSAVKVSAGPVRPAAGAESGEAERNAVLVVEDSITSRMLLKNILESAGYRVKTAVDGAEGLADLKTEDFDLVVSDVQMPRMDGFALTENIRADSKIGELPVVLVTALESRADRERGIEVGANAYIVKSSFDQSNLLEVVRRLI